MLQKLVINMNFLAILFILVEDDQEDESEIKKKKDEIDLIMEGLYKKDQLTEYLNKKPLYNCLLIE